MSSESETSAYSFVNPGNVAKATKQGAFINLGGGNKKLSLIQLSGYKQKFKQDPTWVYDPVNRIAGPREIVEEVVNDKFKVEPGWENRLITAANIGGAEAQRLLKEREQYLEANKSTSEKKKEKKKSTWTFANGGLQSIIDALSKTGNNDTAYVAAADGTTRKKKESTKSASTGKSKKGGSKAAKKPSLTFAERYQQLKDARAKKESLDKYFNFAGAKMERESPDKWRPSQLKRPISELPSSKIVAGLFILPHGTTPDNDAKFKQLFDLLTEDQQQEILDDIEASKISGGTTATSGKSEPKTKRLPSRNR